MTTAKEINIHSAVPEWAEFPTFEKAGYCQMIVRDKCEQEAARKAFAEVKNTPKSWGGVAPTNPDVYKLWYRATARDRHMNRVCQVLAAALMEAEKIVEAAPRHGEGNDFKVGYYCPPEGGAGQYPAVAAALVAIALHGTGGQGGLGGGGGGTALPAWWPGKKGRCSPSWGAWESAGRAALQILLEMEYPITWGWVDGKAKTLSRWPMIWEAVASAAAVDGSGVNSTTDGKPVGVLGHPVTLATDLIVKITGGVQPTPGAYSAAHGLLVWAGFHCKEDAAQETSTSQSQDPPTSQSQDTSTSQSQDTDDEA